MASPFAFAWDVNTPSLSNIEPMWTANMNGDPTTRGTEAAAGLAAKDEGRRCLFLFNVAENAGTECPLIRDDVTWRKLVGDGYDTHRWRDRMRTFWIAYKNANGPRPNMITCEWEEAGVDPALGDINDQFENEWDSLIENPGLKAKLPPSIHGLTSSQIGQARSPSNAFAWSKIAFNQVLYERLNEPLREIVVSTWEELFQTVCPPFSNYNYSVARSSPSYSLFGWPETFNTTINGYSAPEWYVETDRVGTWSAFGPGFSSFTARWVNACRCIDQCKRISGPIFPWIGNLLYPGGGNTTPTNPEADRHFFRHVAKNGVGTWQLFNAGVTDVQSLNDFMATLTVNPDGNVFRPVDPIEQITSGVLTSGDLVTTYVESEWS